MIDFQPGNVPQRLCRMTSATASSGRAQMLSGGANVSTVGGGRPAGHSATSRLSRRRQADTPRMAPRQARGRCQGRRRDRARCGAWSLTAGSADGPPSRLAL